MLSHCLRKKLLLLCFVKGKRNIKQQLFLPLACLPLFGGALWQNKGLCFRNYESEEAVCVLHNLYTVLVYREYTELFYWGIEYLRVKSTPPPERTKTLTCGCSLLSIWVAYRDLSSSRCIMYCAGWLPCGREHTTSLCMRHF